MAIAYKVAGNSTAGKQPGGPTLGPLEKRYFIHGFWPRYVVGILGDSDFDGTTVIWGRRNLRVFEVAMRIEGYKRYKPQTWKK